MCRLTETDRLYLLLIGDESVDMMARYIESGNLHVGSMDNKDVAVIVTVENDYGSVEIKNLAVDAAVSRADSLSIQSTINLTSRVLR